MDSSLLVVIHQTIKLQYIVVEKSAWKSVYRISDFTVVTVQSTCRWDFPTGKGGVATWLP